MTLPKLTPASYIDDDVALQSLVTTLGAESLLAVDTESNSLYAYREQICLVQLSTRTADYIIDPLAIDNMQPLGHLLADERIEKVFHAAEYDVMCLRRDYDFQINNLFDTMMAARVCGYKSVGLGKLLEAHVDVVVDKRHQRDNWGLRPLPAENLLYAQRDTHYLPILHDALKSELEQRDSLQEAREIFEEICHAAAAEHNFNPDGYWRIILPHSLKPRQTAFARALYHLREGLAEKRGYPPFKIFGDRVLIALSERGPRNKHELAQVRGMSAGQIRRYGSQILEAIEHARKADPPARPRRSPAAPPPVLERYAALHEWRKTHARKRKVEADVILSKNILWTFAERAPANLAEMQDIPGFGPWRRAQYAQEIVELLAPLSD